MRNHTRRPGKSVARGHQDAIFRHLRKQITSGRLRPGQRLPAQWEIAKKFDTSPLTVARAFGRLIDMGFSRAEPRLGTFVADRPPHLTRYGLVFQGSPTKPAWIWGRFENAIIEASQSVAAQDGISFANYYDVSSRPDSEGYQALMRDIENERLAGIIFTFAPAELEGTDLMERTSPPRVRLQETPNGIGRGHDWRRFVYRAVDRLVADGRQRFAVITKPADNFCYPDEFEAAVTSRGITYRPFWTQAVEPHYPRWVRHALKAILSVEAPQRPDALLITDDHLVEPVAEALIEFGVRVPQDIRVIGHWNFPLRYRGKLPIELLGFDTCELLRMWIQAIDGQRRGENVTPFAMLPARFEWELRGNQNKVQKIVAGDPAPLQTTYTQEVLLETKEMRV